MDPPTVIALKQAFLELETRQLAQSLAPSRAWQRKNDLRENNRGLSSASGAALTGGSSTNDGGRRLPPKIVDDVLARANQILILHGRRVHPPAAVRHVAEQLDRLYQNASDQMVAAPSDLNNEILDRGMDYTTTSAILGLPLIWDDLQESDALPLESRRYTERLTELRGLAERRTATAARVGRLREMVSLLEGVSLTQTTPQGSLVTREGPVEAGLERMRVLLARVGDRVPGLPKPVPTADSRLEVTVADGGVGENAAVTHDIRDVEEVVRQRVKALLGSF
ncbi:hypothetical protein SEPCBS57363_004701 [Sporothrix epigloea]|uniref:Kinetochore protein fta4 n=1 Tax=Sporothrix epigloea TaxID=1892477 RepID=A0ABP0DX92_9PEZI